MSIEQLIMYLTPLIVWGVTELIKLIPKIIPGWVIISIIVPILSALVAWIATLINPEGTWFYQFLYSLLAVFINEFIRQVKQSLNK